MFLLPQAAALILPTTTAAAELGKAFADEKVHAVFGGGGIGLMGIFADSLLGRRRSVTGVIPGIHDEGRMGS